MEYGISVSTKLMPKFIYFSNINFHISYHITFGNACSSCSDGEQINIVCIPELMPNLKIDFSYYLIQPVDIDECSSDHNCHSDANCTNFRGSFNCTCKHGYQGNGSHCEGWNKTCS